MAGASSASTTHVSELRDRRTYGTVRGRNIAVEPGIRRRIRVNGRMEPRIDEQQQAVACADMFFVATVDKDSRTGASHRGGNPGFV